jgi:hypothetical protein
MIIKKGLRKLGLPSPPLSKRKICNDEVEVLDTVTGITVFLFIMNR